MTRLVLLHGFLSTPREWDLVRPLLERDHEVLTPALAGHIGGPPFTSTEALIDAVEPTAPSHLVGSSLGGYVALKLAERGRALSVVALAPAGGYLDVLDRQERFLDGAPLPLGNAPHELREHLAHASRATPAAREMLAYARQHGYPLDFERVACPVRIVWGTDDPLLPYPAAAERFRRNLNADWVELDGVGHAPQLDAPLVTAQLIDGFANMCVSHT